MFVGKSIHTLGKDGRISIPSKMRDVFINKFGSDELYMVLMPHDILCLFPSEEFEKLTGTLEDGQGGSTDEMMEKMQRDADICSAAVGCKIDASGRILIPSEMQEAAQIEQEEDVLVIGARNHVQLWNPDLWNYDRKLRGVSSTDKAKKLKSKSSAA